MLSSRVPDKCPLLLSVGIFKGLCKLKAIFIVCSLYMKVPQYRAKFERYNNSKNSNSSTYGQSICCEVLERGYGMKIISHTNIFINNKYNYVLTRRYIYIYIYSVGETLRSRRKCVSSAGIKTIHQHITIFFVCILSLLFMRHSLSTFYFYILYNSYNILITVIVFKMD
jgi:hypothetical protein